MAEDKTLADKAETVEPAAKDDTVVNKAEAAEPTEAPKKTDGDTDAK